MAASSSTNSAPRLSGSPSSPTSPLNDLQHPDWVSIITSWRRYSSSTHPAGGYNMDRILSNPKLRLSHSVKPAKNSTSTSLNDTGLSSSTGTTLGPHWSGRIEAPQPASPGDWQYKIRHMSLGQDWALSKLQVPSGPCAISLHVVWQLEYPMDPIRTECRAAA